MKAAYTLLLGIALNASSLAQDDAAEDKAPGVSDAVRKAIEEFNRRKAESKEKANEVLVVLDPPAAPADAAPAAEEPAQADTPDKPTESVLVTGKPPAESKDEVPQPQPEGEPLAAEQVQAEAEDHKEAPVMEPPVPEKPALEARVESIRSGNGKIDPNQIKLKAGFPAKPLSTAPDGWILEKSELAPVFRKDVELQPGATITLNIRPHVLSPAADGINTFSVGEPGFDPSHGYRQMNTVSAILGTSVAQLDQDSLQLGNAISELHRLLASLPKPEEPESP